MVIGEIVYAEMLRFPICITFKTEQIKQDFIKEYEYLVSEATGKLYEQLLDNIESIKNSSEQLKARLHNDKILKMIEHVEWQFQTWSNGESLKIDEQIQKDDYEWMGIYG